MKLNNEIAEDIIVELKSSVEEDIVSDVLVSLREQDDTWGAQIAAECLKRVLPSITADEHVQVATDVLRWYVDGECLDCEDVDGWGICKH